MRNTLFLFTFLFSSIFFAQNIDEAKKVIDTLTSPYFAGRGAVDEGEKKAAEFIVNEFKRNQLKSFNGEYLQKFQYPINTFPEVGEVKLEDKKLELGGDFIVGASSGETVGTYSLVWYNKSNLPTKKELKELSDRQFFADKFIVVDDEETEEFKDLIQLLKINVFGAAGVIILEDKLTHSLSNTYDDFATLHVKRGVMDRKENRKISVEIEHQFIPKFNSQNVIGYVKGEEHPDSIIILSAHYDHLGKIGEEVYFPGANDNASGVAMLLNLAYHYTHKEVPKKTIVFIAFGAEEAGLIGSKYFVENPLFPIENINFVMNMDLMGTGSEGAMIVNARVFPKHFEQLNKINSERDYLVQLKQRGKAANSDHYWFSEKGIPAFFIYLMGGIKAYHDVDDVAKTLPLTKFEDSFKLIRDFVDDL